MCNDEGLIQKKSGCYTFGHWKITFTPIKLRIIYYTLIIIRYTLHIKNYAFQESTKIY